MFYVSDSNHSKVIQIYYVRTVALIKHILPSEPVLDCLSCFDFLQLNQQDAILTRTV